MSTPEDAEPTSVRVGLEADDVWPRYEHDPDLRRAADAALIEVTGLRSTPRGGPGGAPAIADTVHPLLTMTCAVDLHRHEWPPTVGLVYSTSLGPLLVAANPGRWSPDEDLVGGSSPGDVPELEAQLVRGDDPVPVRLVRVLLDDPEAPAHVSVKCRRHGEAPVSTVKLRAAVGRVAEGDPPDAPTRWVPLDRLVG